MPPRPVLSGPLSVAVLLLPVLAAAGCTTVGPGGSADRAPAARSLSAVELRAAAVAGAELGGGYTVTLMSPGQDGPPAGAGERQVSDVPACQPVLDAIGPADPAAQPQAETDLSVTRAGTPAADVYTALLGYPAGRSTVLVSTLDQVFAQCGVFTSTSTGAAGAGGSKAVRTRHQLARAADTPTPEGADEATAFTLTSDTQTGDGAAQPLVQRAAVVRVGTALAVFSTVGTASEPAAAPDPAVLRAQVRKLRAAQG